jgi:hypothetical protein
MRIGSGQSQYEKDLRKSIDATVAKLKPKIEDENAAASLQFREDVSRESTENGELL